jgi:hypothetical protein
MNIPVKPHEHLLHYYHTQSNFGGKKKTKSLGITPIKMGQPALKPPLKLKIWKGVSVGAHISTLDGQRYPFAKCGTYEMWGLRGVPAKALGGAQPIGILHVLITKSWGFHGIYRF